MIIKKGIAVSSGIAIGKCYPVDRNKVFISGYRVKDAEAEIKKLKDAVNYTSDVIENLRYSNIVGKVNRELYEAYKLLLEDELFIGEAESIVRKEKINAEYALKKVRDNIISAMSAADNQYIRERVHDIEHIYQRLQRHMSNIAYDEFEAAGGDDIIISNDITASDIDIMIKKGIKGFATNLGSKHSHNAIISRSAGLIAIIGLRNIYEQIKKDDIIILDGFLGQIIINPDEKTLTHYEGKRTDYLNFISACSKIKDVSCKTSNGEELHLYANVENNHELTLIDVYGLKGVGLYRTEFVYMNNPEINEEHQFNTYLEASKKLRDKEFVLRSFDFGGDKAGKYLSHTKEENPALGLRAIRYCLKYPDFFREQLRAILRISGETEVKLMLPMVSSVDEILAVKEVLLSECALLEQEGIKHNKNMKVGIMVELPATALSLEKFVPYADFFSIGTNDLIQYVLGVDRNNSDVNHLYSPAHHSVVMVLEHILKTALCYDKPISLCGEIAGDYRYLALLLGIGYRSFSMNPRSSYLIRKAATLLDTTECEKMVMKLKSVATLKESEETISHFNEKYLKDMIM